MSKKTIITVSVILSLLFLSLIAYYFLISGSNNGTGGGISSGFKGLFQFGQNNNPPTETATSTEQKPPEEKPADNFTQKLRKLSSEPVAGAGTLDVKAGTIVRYIEVATGHIYEIEMFSPRKARISNTTIPVAYNAVWGNKNNSLITQYLADDNETIDTYSLSLKNISTSTENSITGIALPKRITSISSYGTEIFYLSEATNQSAGYVSDFENKKARQAKPVSLYLWTQSFFRGLRWE